MKFSMTVDEKSIQLTNLVEDSLYDEMKDTIIILELTNKDNLILLNTPYPLYDYHLN